MYEPYLKSFFVHSGDARSIKLLKVSQITHTHTHTHTHLRACKHTHTHTHTHSWRSSPTLLGRLAYTPSWENSEWAIVVINICVRRLSNVILSITHRRISQAQTKYLQLTRSMQLVVWRAVFQTSLRPVCTDWWVCSLTKMVRIVTFTSSMVS